MSLRTRIPFAIALVAALAGCGEAATLTVDEETGYADYPATGEFESEPIDEGLGALEQALVVCEPSVVTGYEAGRAFSVVVVKADGKPSEVNTANAYALMQAAAAQQGVGLRVVSGFRSMAEQRYLYSCYKNCNCNGCNLAATPGYSNHQSGEALDLNTRDAGVYAWLERNAYRFGFRRTVPSEPWHWEYGGGAVAQATCSQSGHANGIVDSRVFDPHFYLALYPDLQKAFGGNLQAATQHWTNSGLAEGRMGSPAFWAKWYVNNHADLKRAFGTDYRAALNHFLSNGLREGRQASPNLAVGDYVHRHQDLRNAFGAHYDSSLLHYLSNGINEGRRASPQFDPRFYLQTHADVARSVGATNYRGALIHWLSYGRAEGRRAVP